MSARFETLSPGDELPPLARVVTREDVKAYAEASGDRNPLHQDPVFARAAGLPDVIAHGMFTMGHLVRCITEWAGDGAEVTRIHAQFRSPVHVGEEIVAGGRVRDLRPDERAAVLDVWVIVDRDGGLEHAIRRSEAEVRFGLDG